MPLSSVSAATVLYTVILTAPQLVEIALKHGEGVLSGTGALVVNTGKYTGRSPDDKYIVDTPAVHDDIAWGSVNRPIEKEKFDLIKSKMLAYLQNRELYVFDGFAGADRKYSKKFRIINELALQNLFIQNLLVEPQAEDLEDFVPDYTIIAASRSSNVFLKLTEQTARLALQ